LKDFSLDENSIEELIQLLETAKTVMFGQSFSSSPLIPILEINIDLNLRLAQFFTEGGPLEERKNTAVKELDRADSLGNAKMIKVFERPRWAHPDPEISIYFREYARKLVVFKKTGLLSSFMEEKQNGTSITQGRKTKGSGKKATKSIRRAPKHSIKDRDSQKRSRRNGYWARQRKSRIRYKKFVITKNSD
jgi:hypothetical protein